MKNRITKALRATGGFTLVELVVVLVIMGILATMTVPALTGYIDDGKRKQAVTEAQNCVLTGNALAAVQRKADTTEDKSGFKTWAGGGFHDEGSPATDAALMLSEGSGAYYAGDAAGSGTSAGTAADAITTQAKVPGVINTIWFSAGGQVVYLQYTSGNVLVTYTGNGADTVTISTVATPNVPTPVLITPSPIPTDEPLPTPTATAEPKKATITVYAVDKAGNKLAGVPLKITGEGLGLSAPNNVWYSTAAGKAFTLEYPTTHDFTVRINEDDTGSTYYQNFNTVKLELKLDANGKATVTGYGANGSVSADGKEVYLTCLAKPKIFVGYKNAKNQYEKLAGIPVGFTKSGTWSPDKTWTSDTTGYAIGNLENNVTYTVAVNGYTSLDAYFDTSDAKFTFSVNADGKLTPPSATAYFYEDTTTGDYYLVLPARPSNFHLQYTNGKYFPDNKVAFVSGAATALQDSKPDALQFTAPATLAKLFETVKVFSEINGALHTLNYKPALTGLDDFTVTGDYNPNTAGTYTLTIETKYSGSTTLTVTVYDYETYSVSAYGGGAAVLKFGLPWEFYLTRNQDASSGGNLSLGNLVTDGTNRPYLAYNYVGTSYDTVAAAQAANSNNINRLSESKVITNCEECYKDGQWQMDVPAGSLGYFNGKLYISTAPISKNGWGAPAGHPWAFLPDWCYEFVIEPTKLSVTDSLSLDYLKATYTDFNNASKGFDTLTGVKFKVTNVDGSDVGALDSDGNSVSSEFTINAGGTRDLLLLNGTYRLVQTGMAATKDEGWYACSDNGNNDGTTYSKQNMETPASGNPYLDFTVSNGGTVNLVYHPYLTLKLEYTEAPDSLTFNRYKVGTNDIDKDGSVDLAFSPTPLTHEMRFELLPRNVDKSQTDSSGAGTTDGFNRGKLYISTPGGANARYHYDYWLSLTSAFYSFTDNSSVMRIERNASTKALELHNYTKLNCKNRNYGPVVPGSTLSKAIQKCEFNPEEFGEAANEAFSILGSLNYYPALSAQLTDVTAFNSSYCDTASSATNELWKLLEPDKQDAMSLMTWCLCRTSTTSNDWYLGLVNTNEADTGYYMYLISQDSDGNLQYKRFNPVSVKKDSNGLPRIDISDYTPYINNTSQPWVPYGNDFFPVSAP